MEPRASVSSAVSDDHTLPGRAAQEDRRSAFVEGLAESQGTIAVISALIAGFAYSGLCSVTREELERTSTWIQYLFVTSTSLSIGCSAFVTIVLSVCEQEGRVARSFSVLREFDKDFEVKVHRWWKEFAQARTDVLTVFFASIPVFFTSMASTALVKLPPGPSYLGASIILLFAVIVWRQLDHINRLFQARILGTPDFSLIGRRLSAPSLDYTTHGNGGTAPSNNPVTAATLTTLARVLSRSTQPGEEVVSPDSASSPRDFHTDAQDVRSSQVVRRRLGVVGDLSLSAQSE